MALEPMYRAVNGSLPTQITAAVTASAVTIEVEDASVLPDAPNLMTISMEDGAEVIRYGTKQGNTLGECTRGFDGTVAQGWPSGTVCYRAYTAYDHNAFVENIGAVNEAVENSGDMLASTYDTNGSGVVDNSEKLGGQLPAYYAKQTSLATHVDDTAIHVASTDRASWNAKVDAVIHGTTGPISQIDVPAYAEGMPIDATVRFVAEQTGTGDPSPENIRPIVGKSVVNVWRGGKNLFDFRIERFVSKTGTITMLSNGFRVVAAAASQYVNLQMRIDKQMVGKQVTFKCNFTKSGVNIPNIRVFWGTATGGGSGGAITSDLADGQSEQPRTFIVPSSSDVNVYPYINFRFYSSYGGVFKVGDYVEYTNIQLELGSPATPYEPYNGQTYPVTLPEAVYGLPGYEDEIDFAAGIIIKRTAFIPSYNGEEIPGAYRSSTGELSIGSQVVYALAVPRILTIDPVTFPALPRLNTVYTDTGADVETQIRVMAHLLEAAGKGITEETDPTVPGWAKAAQKPAYTYGEITGTPDLATVATSGNYNDLSNKPTIPVLPTLAAVATSGNYGDLINRPAIPATAADVGASPSGHTHPAYEARLDALETTTNGIEALLAAL